MMLFPERESFSVVEGLVLFTDVVSTDLAQRLKSRVEHLLVEGRAGRLPHKSTYKPVTGAFVARQQSRELLQFGCYTHANRVEVAANVASLESEPLLVECVERLEQAGVFDGSEASRPDCCTINVYDVGCWLPPHVDSLHFARPFATLSLGSDQVVAFAPVKSSSGDMADRGPERGGEQKPCTNTRCGTGRHCWWRGRHRGHSPEGIIGGG